MTDEPKPVVVESPVEHALAGGEPQRHRRRCDTAASASLSPARWRRETNTKLGLLAEQIAYDFLHLDYSEIFPNHIVFDRLLLTAHLRVDREV